MEGKNKATSAFLYIGSPKKEWGMMCNNRPACLLPIVGEPLLGHILGRLADMNFTTVVLSGHHGVAEVSEYVEGGARWGLSISIDACKDEASVIKSAQRHIQTGKWIVGSADVFPMLNKESLAPAVENAPLVWSFQNTSSEQITTSPIIDVRTPDALLRSTKEILDGKRADISLPGHKVDKNIYLNHNVEIHPTAKLCPPVVILQVVQIARGVRLGPYAVIGSDCIIGELTTVEDSTIMNNTALGEHLELKNAVVENSSLALASVPSPISIPDAFLSGEVRVKPLSKILANFAVRFFAVVVLFATLPFAILFHLIFLCDGSKSKFNVFEAVRLPTPSDSQLWQTFTYREYGLMQGRLARWLTGFVWVKRYPLLFSIINGDVCLVGNRAYKKDELTDIPNEWRSILVQGRVGLFRQTDIDANITESQTMQHLCSEVYSIVVSTWQQRLSVVWKSLRRFK